MASSSSSSANRDIRGLDGQLSVIAIGPVLKVWIDKVKDSTLVWMQTEGEYPGYPSKEWKTTTWWYAQAKRGWIDDVGTQNMQWIEDLRGEFWTMRSEARDETNAEQAVRKRQYEQFSIEMNTTMKKIPHGIDQRDYDRAAARCGHARRQRGHNQCTPRPASPSTSPRPLHWHSRYDGNRFLEQHPPNPHWINTGAPEQAHEGQQDPWANLAAPAQEGPHL
jgi:hypothetical protein